MTPRFQPSSSPKFVQVTYSAAIAVETFDQGSVYVVPHPLPQHTPLLLSPSIPIVPPHALI